MSAQITSLLPGWFSTGLVRREQQTAVEKGSYSCSSGGLQEIKLDAEAGMAGGAKDR